MIDIKTHVLVIGDRSGSMHNMLNDAVGGFNSLLHDQQAIDADVSLTLVLFDDQYEVIYDDIDVRNIADMTVERWKARGSTALLDAIGKAISNMEARVSTEEEKSQVIIAIMTDGEENSSVEFKASDIKGIISRKESEGWKVMFLAKDLDTVQDAISNYGISANSTFVYTNDTKGLQAAHRGMSSTIRCYATSGHYDTSWMISTNANDFNTSKTVNAGIMSTSGDTEEK